MFSTIITLAASVVGIWAFFKYIVFIEIRVDSNTFKTLYESFKNESKFVLNEEYTSEARHPILYFAFCFPRNIPWFYIAHGERLMQAGWHGKDYVSVITCMRWDYKKFRNFLDVGLKELSFKTHGVPVQILLPYGIDRIGSLKQVSPEPIVNPSMWKDLDNEVAEVVAGKRMKTGALLYGPPGNGKTSLIKYLSTKYRLPIMIFTLNPEWSNHDILLLFAHIPKNCIVLMEDFDNYFDKRNCTIGNTEKSSVKFTFDIILNGLDGVYNSYERVVFMMTVNHIEKVDDALKNRPSRFKFTRNFGNPDHETRCKLIPAEWSQKTLDINLDQVFRLKEYYEQGCHFDEAMKKLNIDKPEAEVKPNYSSPPEILD
jgi:hypothetical protein